MQIPNRFVSPPIIPMKKNLLLFILCLVGWYGFAQATEQIIVLPQTRGVLEGTLLLPPSHKPIPVILIIAGSGPTDRNGDNPLGVKAKSYQLLAEALAQNGIASLRYDKRGIGKSMKAASKEIDMRFEDSVNDAAQFLDTLKKDKRFGKIYILGHSEGSLIGMLLAQTVTVNGYISVAGLSQGIDEVINQQIKAQPFPDSVKNTVSEYLSILKKGQTIPKLMPHLVIAQLFRASVQPYMISWLQYDPSKEIAKLKTKILIIQGDADIQVAEQEGQNLKKAAPKAQYLMIPKMNHALKEGSLDRAETMKNYQNPDLPLIKGLTEGIVKWL